MDLHYIMQYAKHAMPIAPAALFSPRKKRWRRVNGVVGQPSYKQFPNGKYVLQLSAYGQMMDKANTSALKHGFVRKNWSVQAIKQRYPYLDRNILSQYTAFNTDKYPFARIHKGVFKKRKMRVRDGSLLSRLVVDKRQKGIKLELAGRLTTQRSVPRKTVANRHVGKMTNTLPGQYTAKNKLGAYTVKAWLS